MIVLDTNVVSELMRERPQQEVLDWADGHPANTLFITAITEAEIRAGIAVLPEGRRRRELAETAERLFAAAFAERILSFDSEASRAYGFLAASRRAAGRAISTHDCLIAAIARSHAAGVATRDVGGFADCGVEVINPWLP